MNKAARIFIYFFSMISFVPAAFIWTFSVSASDPNALKALLLSALIPLWYLSVLCYAMRGLFKVGMKALPLSILSMVAGALIISSVGLGIEGENIYLTPEIKANASSFVPEWGSVNAEFFGFPLPVYAVFKESTHCCGQTMIFYSSIFQNLLLLVFFLYLFVVLSGVTTLLIKRFSRVYKNKTPID